MTAKITLLGAMCAVTLCLKNEERTLKKEHAIIEAQSKNYCYRDDVNIFSRVKKED